MKAKTMDLSYYFKNREINQLKFGECFVKSYLRPRIFYTKLKTLKMKKVFAIFAIAALTACGGASSDAAKDSATTSVDSPVVAVDSPAMQMDSPAVAVDSPATKQFQKFLYNFLQEGPFRNFGKDFFYA